MSRKGFSPNNSACEGFFGTIKKRIFLPLRLEINNNRPIYCWITKIFKLVLQQAY